MTTFVLTAGAWLGAWAWDDVVPLLEAGGHRAVPITLAGLAERRAESAGLETHVRDIVAAVEAVEAAGDGDGGGTVLVGHSYSGVPVGIAAARLGDRLRRTVFVDANLPVHGEPFVASLPDGGTVVRRAIAAHGTDWPPLPPAAFAAHGLAPDHTADLLARAVPHPGATLTDVVDLPRPLASLTATYLHCRRDGSQPRPDAAALTDGGAWQSAVLDSSHWPMLSVPGELAALLLAEADR
ncbi:alpha/beta fold hydrolase [Kitasatospora sp. NA04385]|uniref:alpha/beta fold hydrolase n=1 Tax=Kitasatospora sp. NA04385 TaxID=2742135 RepID=UPI0015900EDF|nr:alpha/beta fold hydrolase [Kitasatospora sp. NA04385]QKW19060.1 alpha/beta fold hydrolase [Kitasatospora sp. NA04385]